MEQSKLVEKIRRYNKLEDAFYNMYKDKYPILRNGYPDFLLVNPTLGKCCFVEVKAPTGKLSKTQEKMIAVLENIAKIPTIVVRPEGLKTDFHSNDVRDTLPESNSNIHDVLENTLCCCTLQEKKLKLEEDIKRLEKRWSETDRWGREREERCEERISRLEEYERGLDSRISIRDKMRTEKTTYRT